MYDSQQRRTGRDLGLWFLVEARISYNNQILSDEDPDNQTGRDEGSIAEAFNT